MEVTSTLSNLCHCDIHTHRRNSSPVTIPTRYMELLSIQEIENPESISGKKQFEGLPPDLALLMTLKLKKESKLNLNLCNTSLHDTLNNNIDLHLHQDMPSRIRFFRSLEFHFPEYLTCRDCGHLYYWRDKLLNQSRDAMAHRDHECEAQKKRPYEDIPNPVLKACSSPARGIIDLIHRARKWGPQFGLQHTILNGQATVEHNFDTCHVFSDARWVGTNLIFHMRKFMYVKKSDDEKDMYPAIDFMRYHACAHWYNIITARHMSRLRAKWSGEPGGEEPTLTKCPWCLTDSRLSMEVVSDNVTKVQLDTWRNYEDYDADTLSSDNMFDTRAKVKLDADEVAERDLESAFRVRRGRFVSRLVGASTGGVCDLLS